MESLLTHPHFVPAALVYQQYLAQGYIPPSSDFAARIGAVRNIINLWETNRANVISVQNDSRKISGVISLILDNSQLPTVDSNTDFQEAIEEIRRYCREQGLRLGYVGTFATNPKLDSERLTAYKLFSELFVTAGRLGVDAFVAVVNPCHESFYIGLGGERRAFSKNVEPVNAEGVMIWFCARKSKRPSVQAAWRRATQPGELGE